MSEGKKMNQEEKKDGLSTLELILDNAGVFIIWALTLLTFLGVILRYIFKMYAPATSEFPTVLMVILAFILCGVLWKKNKHIILDFIYVHLNDTGKYILDLIFVLAGLMAGCFWLWGSINLYISDLREKGVSLEMGIPLGYYHIFEVIGWAIFIAYMLMELKKSISIILPREVNKQ
jgi:TRAP-type C4-dicarboxylate transport system permease small subunit